MSNFVNDLMAEVKAKNPNEPEFHQAVQEVAESVALVYERYPEYRAAKIFERIIEPERLIMFRVAWTDLERYISLGAPDLSLPTTAGTWFDPRDTVGAEQFVQAVIDAGQDQVLDAAAGSRLVRDAAGESVTVELQVTPAIAAVLASPPKTMFKQPLKDSRYPTWPAVYLAGRLRNAAWNVVSGPPLRFGRLRLEALYESPEDYRRILAEVQRTTLAGGVSFSQIYASKTPGVPGLIFYVLPHAVIAAGANLQQAIDLTF